MANNKVTIYIHNQRYRFLAEENEDYLQPVSYTHLTLPTICSV